MAQQTENAGGSGNNAGGSDRARRQRHRGRLDTTSVGEQDLHSAERTGLGVRQRVDGGIPILGQHRVGERAQGGRDRSLKPGLHLNVFGNQPTDARALRGDQSTRTVLLVECQRQRTNTRTESIALALETVQFFPKAIDRSFGRHNLGLRTLVVRVEIGFARVAECRASLHLGELGASHGTSATSSIQSVLLAQNFTAQRGQTRRCGVELTAQLRNLEIVTGDQRTLMGNFLIQRIEGGSRQRRCRLRIAPRRF